MRVNEYNSLEEFTSQYIGEWGPSDGHWLGLDFEYHGRTYRFHTGTMHLEDPEYLDDGSEVLFGLYKVTSDEKFELIAQFKDMEGVLDSTVIENTPFRTVIMADETLLTGQD